MVLWLALSGIRFPAGAGLSVWSLHVLPVIAWVLSGYSSSNSHSPKTCKFRLIVARRCECERDWLSVSMCQPNVSKISG